MNKLDKALHEMCSLDKEASGDRKLNKVPAGIKMILTFAYILAVMWIDLNRPDYLILMLAFPTAIFILSDISFIKCFGRMKYVMGFVAVMAAANFIFSKDKTEGLLLMAGLLLKGMLTVIAAYILIVTTKIEKICGVLRKIHIPEIIVTTILLTYRYINILIKEFKRMSESYQMMAVSKKGIDIKYSGAFLGNLILRSIDKAKVVYDSMNLRGYEWFVENENSKH